MKPSLLLVLFACLAGHAAADCGWQDDGAMATALSNSNWTVATVSGMRVKEHPEASRFQVDLVPETQEFTLSIGSLLRDSSLDGQQVDITLVSEDLAENGHIKPGRATMVIPFPSIDDSACGNTDLSALLVTSGLNKSLGVRMVLRATQNNRLVGILQISGIKSLYAAGAALYNVEASPAL